MTTRAILYAVRDQLRDAINRAKEPAKCLAFYEGSFDDVPEQWLAPQYRGWVVVIEYKNENKYMQNFVDNYENVRCVRAWPYLFEFVDLHYRLSNYIEACK